MRESSAMAACGSLHQIFENPPHPPPPPLPHHLHPLSQWDHNKPHRSSFTDIFADLHFQDHPNYPQPQPQPQPQPASSSSSSIVHVIPGIEKLAICSGDGGGGSDCDEEDYDGNENKKKKRSSLSMDSFPSFRGNSPTMTSERLQLCTEGLGFESSDDMEDFITDDAATTKKNDSQNSDEEEEEEEKANLTKKHSHSRSESDSYSHLHLHSSSSGLLGQDQDQSRKFRRSKSYGGAFPPPISSIGKAGKPRVSFKSFRKDGRFVLKEIRVPTREFLHAFRENGRLKLQLFQPEEGIMEEEEDEEEESTDDLKGGGDHQ